MPVGKIKYFNILFGSLSSWNVIFFPALALFVQIYFKEKSGQYATCPLQRVFYPQNRPCTPKIVRTFYMQGYKVKEKNSNCTPFSGIVPPVSKLSGHPVYVLYMVTLYNWCFCGSPQKFLILIQQNTWPSLAILVCDWLILKT